MPTDPAILTALRASADELARELDRLPESAADWRVREGEWSQLDCLKHIQLIERFVFLARLQAMAAQDNPFLPFVDETELQRQARDVPRAELLRDFLDARQQEIALLEQCDWARPGQHQTRGPISMGWIAHYALGHTWEHLSQITRVRLDYETRKP